MTKLFAALRSSGPDALMIAGAGAVSYGAAQIYAPLGYLVGGVFAILAGLIAAKGS